jgi:hypothetical protein
MLRRSNRFPPYCLLAAILAVGCTSGRELVGTWTAVDSASAPTHMAKIVVSSGTEMTLDDGQVAKYSMDSKEHTITVTFATGATFTYGFSRSGENMTLVDSGKRIRYFLDQG